MTTSPGRQRPPLRPTADQPVLTLRFTASPRGARLARRLASQQMDAWGWPYGTPVHDAVELVVAELAANAVTHGLVPGRDAELRLSAEAGHVRVEVSDARGERLPTDPVPAPRIGSAAGRLPRRVRRPPHPRSASQPGTAARRGGALRPQPVPLPPSAGSALGLRLGAGGRRCSRATDRRLADRGPRDFETTLHRSLGDTLLDGGLIADTAQVYLAPETDQEFADPVDLDVFGLGSLTYLLLTGRPSADRRSALLERLQSDGGLQPYAVSDSVSAALDSLVFRATAADVRDRLASVDEFLGLLGAAETDAAAPEPSAGPAADPEGPSDGSRPVVKAYTREAHRHI